MESPIGISFEQHLMQQEFRSMLRVKSNGYYFRCSALPLSIVMWINMSLNKVIHPGPVKYAAHEPKCQ